MNIIKAVKLAYEYKRYGEDGQVEETLRAVAGVDLDVKKGDFVAILGHKDVYKRQAYARRLGHEYSLRLRQSHHSCGGQSLGDVRAGKHV